MILSVLNSMCIRVALRVHLRCVLDAFRVHGDFAGCSAYRVRFRMHFQGAHRARLGCIFESVYSMFRVRRAIIHLPFHVLGPCGEPL